MLQTAELDALPFATDVYQKHLKIENYNVPFLLNPYVSFYTTRGCPALCTFCLWPQTLSGHAWRVRSVENVAREFKQAHKMFPQAKEFFFDDDTFNIRKDRVLALCKEFKPVGFQWSCTARVHSDYETLKAMADAGARLLIVGFESGDPQILKNIKKGATIEMGRTFVQNCKKVGIHVHGDFIIGLPGETKETIEKTIEYAQGAGLRDDSGFHGARLSGHRALRSGNEGRVPGGRSDYGRHGAPAAAPAVSGPLARIHGGVREPLLRRILFPPARGLAHRARCVVGFARAQTPVPRSRGFHEAAPRPPQSGQEGRAEKSDGASAAHGPQIGAAGESQGA